MGYHKHLSAGTSGAIQKIGSQRADRQNLYGAQLAADDGNAVIETAEEPTSSLQAATRSMNDARNPTGSGTRPPVQFTIRDMLLATVIVAFSVAIYLGLTGDAAYRPVYDVLACTAPLVLVSLAGLAHGIAWTVGKFTHRHRLSASRQQRRRDGR